jgi:mevalonate kinase
MSRWQEYLKPSEWEVIVRTPGNFFLAGEHAVMFGHPAVCQALPLYFYVGLRRRLRDEKVNIDADNTYFVDCLDFNQKSREFIFPSRIISCQLEHLLAGCGWFGVDIGLYSELPSMCGLASSGALAAALSLGLHYLFDREINRKQINDFLKRASNPARMLGDIIQDTVFSKYLFPQAWIIDSLFHNHQSSGTNAFFSLVGSPEGLPAWYRQKHPRKSDLDNPSEGFKPSRIFSEKALCPDFGKLPKSGIKCHKQNICANFSKIYPYYSKLEYEAKSLMEDYPNAGCGLFDFCCALIYSGRVKTTELAIKRVKERVGKVGDYFSKIEHLGISRDLSHDVLMAYLGSISEELWGALGQYFSLRNDNISNGIIEIIGFAQSGLRNLLGISTQGIDSISRHAELMGFGAKLTGGGTGGDVVIISKSKDWKKLMEFVNSQESENNSQTVCHFQGRWPYRELACVPVIEKSDAYRFIFVLDIIKSGTMRTRSGDSDFDKFSDTVNRLAGRFEGIVLSYHKTDDQRIIAFETEDNCKKISQEINNELEKTISKQCRWAYLETPFDWNYLKNLEPSSEQSDWLGKVIEKIK